MKFNSLFGRLARSLPGLLLSLAVLPLAALGQTNYATPYTFTTLAGNTGYGSADGTNRAARFASPRGVTVDSAGTLYVADKYNDTIRKVTPVGTNWVVTTLAGLPGYAGSVDGTGNAARFNAAEGVAVDSSGNVYVADFSNDTFRELTPAGVVTTLAGLAGVPGSANGTGSAARFNGPDGVAVDINSNVYVADYYSDTIRKLTPVGTTWAVTTLAGKAGHPGSANGTETNAEFNYPVGVAVDTNGNVYVADTGNAAIRKVTPAGDVTTLSTNFSGPTGVAVGTNGNVYVADFFSDTIREMTPEGVVTIIAGEVDTPGTNDGTGSAARFNVPYGVAVDSAGNLYVSDSENNTIREVTPVGANWVVTTVAGLATGGAGSADGTGTNAQFNEPMGLALDTNGNIYVGDFSNDTIREVTPAGVVTTLAGLAGVPGTNDGTGTNAEFNGPTGMAVDSAGNLYVGDYYSDTIRKLTPVGTNWAVTTLAGEGGNPGSANGSPGQFDYPIGVAVDTNGNVYVADTGNAAIRKVTPVGVVTTVSKDFSGPTGVAVGPDGNVYVVDYFSDTIRKMTPAGAVTLVAGLSGTPGTNDGTGVDARFDNPWGLAVDSAGNLYVGDRDNDTIRKVTPVGTTWVVTTPAGLAPSYGYADGTGSVARFRGPSGVAVDSATNVYVMDTYNNTIRKGYPSPVPAPILQPPSLSAGQFGFGITGLTNLELDLESSGDLTQWQVVSTLILEGGTSSFVISPNPSQDAQFYRIHVR